MIENDNLTYLYLARADAAQVGVYGTNPTSSETTSEGGGSATANNPAALSSYSHALQIADMIRTVHEDGTPLVDGYAARHPVEIILGIYQSARTHQEVTFL